MGASVENVLHDGIGACELIQVCGNDKMVVNAARVSLGRDGEIDEELTDRDKKLIKFLLAEKHGTPFEHNLITYRVTAPLYVVQEMLRHRIGVSVNQLSHRYTEATAVVDGPHYYIPRVFRRQSTTNLQSSAEPFCPEDNDMARVTYEWGCDEAIERYKLLIAYGVCREQARGVLPHSVYTKLYYTLNLRSLFHFLSLRLPSGAQWEIRQYAYAMYKLAEEYFPFTLSAAGEAGVFPTEVLEDNR